MMAFQHSACFFIWAVFLLSFTNAAPAPAAEGDLAHSQALDLHNTEAGSSRCYYNFQHYEEGDRIITNEPCLNCTCHKRMLMCYLRVCPFTKPVGQDCTVEKKPDQCCPVITCPEVHVDIVTSSTTETSSAVGHIGKYGCTLEDNTFYPDGVQMPSDPKKPCELCYCIRNHTACVRQECTLNVEGCRPVYQDGVCCPVRYDCDYNEISTTERPSSGGLLLGTTASTTQKCRYGDVMYNDGELIETDKPCESCYCMRGDIVCAVRSCGEPMEGKDCHALPPPEGQCCPTTFQCANGTISIENMATESSIIMQSSPTDTDVSTKEPEPQPSSEVTSDDEAEDVKNKDDLATPTTEVLPSDSPNEEENHGHKHEEEKVDEHPEGQILSEPTDEDELDDEDLDIHSDPNIHEPETEGPKISEQTSTSAPDTAEKVETETQSHGVSEVNTSESPIAISENDQVDQNKEDKNGSVKDEIKPDGNEHSESDIENTTGTNELVPEQHEIVTEISLKPEETSESKLNDPVNNEVSESTNTEVATSDAELPREPTIEKESTESKDENGVVNTKLGEESPVTALTGEENGPSNNAVAGNSLPETLHAAGVGGDEQTEPSKNTYLETESSVERDQQPEKVDGSSITNENEIKFEEIPSKTPESLDQVKESDISQETVDTNTNQYPESQTSEPASVPAQDDNQMVTNDQEKVVDVVPEQTNAEGVAPSVLPEEHIENFHKEQAPPRKEDSSLEEHEQVPQHPEGSMTKAEDSIPDGQSQSEDGITELPESANIPGKQNEHQGPGEISIPPESTENSVTHDYSNESEVNVPQEGQHGDGSDSQTQQPNVTPSLEPNSEKIETNYVSGIATESTTGPYSNDIVPEKTETTNMDIKPTDAPLKEGSVVSENESVPTVIVMEQESETSTDSLPQESSHGEVKPQTTLPEDSLHDLSNDVEDDHQSHDEQTAETEKEVTPAKPEVEEQLIGDKNSEDNLNVSFESTQSPSDIDAVTDGQTHSNDVSDDNGSLDDLNKDMHGVTDGEITSENTDKLEETALSGDGTVSPVEEISTEKEDSDQSHSDTAESAGLPNEITQNEGEKHNSDKQPEQTEGVEESTGSVIKTGSESHPEDKESEKKGESPNVESAESSKNPTPEITLPDGEVHHDPVESEPTEFDDNEFEDSGDHDPTSENEIVEDHLSGQGGSIPHESSSNIPGPVGVIPGEGDCLVDGQTYTNNSNIPSKSPCHKECTCISSIVHCQGIDCPPPPPELANCMPVHQGDLCCPVYTCDGNTPEGPQSHNQMGETEDKTDSPTETKKHSEGTEHATITGEETPDSEHTISESETTMLDNKPTEHKEDSQGEETTAPVQNIPNTVGDEISEIASDNSNGETPGPDTVVQEHNSVSGDDKTPADNGTAIVVTPEDNEGKPNADVSDIISAVKEKDSQPTVLTDQNESQDTEVHDQTHTESPGVEESPSKPDETPTVLEEDDGSAPHSSAIPVTETSHTLTGETQETEEHPEPEIETENGPETNTHTLTDSVDDDLPTATENNPELVSESDSHVPSEETQTENESVSPSSAEQSETPVQQIEDGKNTFETNQVSGDLPLLNEGMENNKQDIVTETPITVSQEVIKQDLPVTEEPIVSETLVTGKPNLEGNNQHDVTHKDGTYQDSESEHQPGSAVDSAVQNGSNGSETTSVEDTATEVVPNAPEGPAEVNNKVNSETDKEQNTTEQHPLHEQNINGQTDEKQNEDDSNYENVTSSTDSGSEFEGNLNSENKATLSNKENEAETNTNTAPKASHDETGNTEDLQGEVTEGSLDLHLGQSTQAPTLNDPSTQSPSPSIEHNEDLNSETATSPESIGDHVPNGDSTLDGDNTSNLTTHETPSETENQETTHDQSLETISAIKETENQKTTHDQSLETISANKDTNSDSNNHQIEPETTESLQNSDLETTEITNEIEEHVSGSPNQEEHHPEHETSQPAQEIGLPEQEISESPESSKTEDSPAEGISHDGDDGTVHEDEKIPNNFDEEPSHGTEITMGEDNNEEGNPAHGETAQVNQGTESINNEEELTKPYITETTQEETTPAQEATHEESKPANEETGSVEEDTSPENQEPSNEEVKPDIDESKLSQEESEPPHMTSKPAQEETQLGHEAGNEEPEPANDETEQAHENTQSTDETHQANEEPEIAQEDTEPIHEDSGIIHEQIVPVQGETEPEHDEIGLVHEDTEPDHEVTKPVHGESQLQGETEPAHGNTEPVHEDTEPLHGETEPAQEEIVPIHEDSETDHEKAKPVDGEAQVPVELETVQGETEPSHEGTEPAQEETEPAQEETESAQEGTEPVQEGTEPAQEGTEPAQEGTEPVHEDTEPAQEETKPIQEETEPAHTEAEPVHEQTELVHEDSEPVHEEAKPDNEETEPAHTETNPAHEDTEPAHEEIEPAHEETEPAHEETEPAHEETGPTHEETEPAHEETEPAHTEIMPAQEETESTDEESKPTQEEPELTTAKTETTHEETEHGNEVPVNEVEHDQESDTSIHDSEQSTTKTDLTSENENIPQEPENEDEHHSQEHPVLETEQTIEPIKPNTDSEHAHEAEQTPDNNIIGDGEDPSLPTGQTVDEHEQEHEQTIHETDIPHPQVPGSMPSMTGTDDSKPQHNKPDDPELPPEDQFTPDVEMDYDVSEDGAFGPGTCRYGGKVYVSAQQIPRDDPCDFCFCFRSDIICLQQSCPPPIHRCHQEPIQGYCCPRYQCPVSMATSLNITTTTSTTTTTLPPHFFAHAYRGAARQSGCFHRGRAYEVGEEITSASGPCLQCICGSDGQMQCDPKVCNPEPMVRKLMEAAVSHRRR